MISRIDRDAPTADVSLAAYRAIREATDCVSHSLQKLRRRTARTLLFLAATTLPASAYQATIAAMTADANRRITLSQFPQAEQKLREVLALAPETTEAHYLLGYTLFREQRARESLAEYTVGARLRTPMPEELVVVASDYILLNDMPDAEKWLLYAAGRQPLNASTWYLLGRTQYNRDHAFDAFQSFQRCLELRPRDIRAEYNLGLAYEKLQRPVDAISAYQTAIAWQTGKKEQDPQPYLDLGTLLLREGKTAEALGPMRQAVDFGPRNALANQELGLALERLGRYEEAVEALQRAAALAPGAEQPHFFLGRIFRHLGRIADAAAEYATVSKLLGSHSDTATPNPDQQP